MMLEFKNDLMVEVTGGNQKSISMSKRIGLDFNKELRSSGINYEYLCSANKFIIHYTDFDKFKSILTNYLNN